MSPLADLVADVAGQLGRLALIPAVFVAAFLVRVERWHRLVPRAVEAIRARIAEGGAGGEL